MKYYVIFFYIIANIIVSCGTNIEGIVCDVSIIAQKVNIDSADSYKFPKILVNNILVSGKEDHYSSILSGINCQKADTLFRFGKGHNEFQHVSFGRGVDGSLLLLNCPLRGNKIISLTAMYPDSIGVMSNVNKWQKYDLLNLPAFRFTSQKIVAISDSTILLAGAPYHAIGHIFSIIDFFNQKVYPLEYWPEDDVKCDSIVKHAIYTNNSSLFGNGQGRYLYQCNDERFAFIFSIKGNKVADVKELFSVHPDYSVDRTKENYIYNSISPEALECTANSNNIYALLRDSDRKGARLTKWKNPYVFGNVVVVYDWDGNKVKTICLDKYGQDVFVTDDNKTLYLFTKDYFEDDSKPEIWAYDLSGLDL